MGCIFEEGSSAEIVVNEESFGSTYVFLWFGKGIVGCGEGI